MNEVHYKNVQPASWKTTYIFKPEMKLLTESVLDYGWIAPIVVRKEDSTIIDGFSRWVISQDKRIVKRDKGIIPVTFVDCDEVDAMIMHVRLNRAKGSTIAKPLSRLLKRIIASKKYDESIIQEALRMTDEEFDLLVDGSLIKTRKLKEHKYSNAWVPVEAPPPDAQIAGEITIERPPNADR
jgi:ParB-like chromosome segregation protein Spo0J